MKKILSLVLAALLLVSMIPTVMAADVDVSEGTTIKVVGTQESAGESYTVTVPAKLQPGQSGTVKASGTWESGKTLKVTAPNSVTVSYGDQSMDIGITFAGITLAGNDLAAVSASADVTVADATALFGTWTGTLNYTVELVEDSTGGDSGTTEPSDPEDGKVVFTIDGTEYERDTGATWGTTSISGATISFVEDGVKLNGKYIMLNGVKVQQNDLIQNAAYVTGDGEEANLITFTIDGTTYQAEDGMTWGEWVASDYNTDGFYVYVDDGSIFTSDGIEEILDVKVDMTIESTQYSLHNMDV